MFYIENKNGIYPLNSCLNIRFHSNESVFLMLSGNTITKTMSLKEAQDLIEKIQEAVNNGESYYYVNED